MNRKLKKIIAGMVLAFMVAAAGPCGQLVSWAADAAIAFSDPSVMVGNDVTVTMKVTSTSALGTAEIMLAYDPNILEFVSGTSANGGAGAIKILGTMDSADQKSFSFTLKFKTLQAGSTQITVTSQEIYDVNSQALTLSKQGTSTVKVTSPATYSKDATLKSLKISPGTLTPGFSPSVDTYQAQVDANTGDLVVNAVAANAGAHVSLQGEKGLKAGVNQVVVKVTAEDGQTVKNYTIQVTKPEGGETVPATEGTGEAGGTGDTAVSAEFGSVTATIDGTEYSIATSFDETALPEGFEAETYQYKGTDVMAGKGLEKDLLLLYLKDSGGNGGFFIYNEGADSWSRFVQVETSSKAIVIIPLDGDAVVPEGFVERQADIDGVRVTGWVPDSEAAPQYCLFYAMNWNGEKSFYRYDLTEKTVQRYFASGVSSGKYDEIADTYNSLIKDYHLQFYILIAVSILALVLLVVVIVLLRKGNGRDFKKPDKGGSSEDRLYDEPEEEIPSSKIKRYSREEYDREASNPERDFLYEEEEADKPGRFGNAAEDEPMEDVTEDSVTDDMMGDAGDEDDFIMEASLEDMERDLISRKNGSAGTKRENESRSAKTEKDEDDFEFIDLDD
ncbi:MAG: cadherin-like beta sandwich domain-containing protein [Lacrimispora sp.]